LQVYIHCTAGLGRAPAACIAWMYWFGNRQLDEVRENIHEFIHYTPLTPKIRFVAAVYVER